MLENFIKWALAAVAVGIIGYIVFGVFAQEVGATSKPKETYKWVEVGTEWSGVCKAEAPVCDSFSEGVEYGVMTEECQKVDFDEVSRRVKPECKKGDTRTTEVSRSCEVKGDSCPIVPPVKEDTPDRLKFTYTQGVDKGEGDGMCKLQWKPIKGSKKVEIRYAEDSIFGNGYRTMEVKDDGHQWVNVTEGLFKIRGRDSKTEWSETHRLSC